jgi:hypothetical protein
LNWLGAAAQIFVGRPHFLQKNALSSRIRG